MKKMMSKLTLLLLALTLVFSLGAAQAEEPEYALTLTCPNGAPALSVAILAAEHPENFTFISADTIAAAFTTAEADFIIAPVNAGAKLYKAGKSTYRLAGVVTWGNLYFASQRENFSLEDLKSNPLTLFGPDTINASVALYALKQNGIEPVLADPLAGAAETKVLLETDPEAIVLTAEPMLTSAMVNNDKITAISVNDLLSQAGIDGYTQAGLFVRAETLEQHPDAVNEALVLIEGSANQCDDNPDAVAEALGKLDMKFPKPAISKCAVNFVYAAQARPYVEATVAIDPAQFGGELPADDFYYYAE